MAAFDNIPPRVLRELELTRMNPRGPASGTPAPNPPMVEGPMSLAAPGPLNTMFREQGLAQMDPRSVGSSMTAMFREQGLAQMDPRAPGINEYMPQPQMQMQMGQMQAPPMPPPPAQEQGPLIERVGMDPAADRAMALARGGFNMAAAAGKPGATFLGALGVGGGLAVEGTMADRARETKRLQDEELLGIKKLTSRAALAKALKEGTTETQKLIEYRDTLPEGGKEWKEVNAIIEKKGSYNDTFGEIEKLIRARDAYDEGTPDWNRLNAIIEKKGRDTKDPALAIIEALNSQTEESEKAFGKAMGTKYGEIVAQGDAAPGIFSTANRLDTALRKSVETGARPGGFASGIQRLKEYAEGFGYELGFELPEGALTNPDFQFSEALQKSLVRDLLKSKMGSKPTDRDLQFMIDTLPNMGIGPKANKMLIDGLYSNAISDVEKSIKYLKYRDEKGLQGGGFALQEQQAAYESMMEQLLDRVETGWKPDPDSKLKEQLRRYMIGKQNG